VAVRVIGTSMAISDRSRTCAKAASGRAAEQGCAEHPGAGATRAIFRPRACSRRQTAARPAHRPRDVALLLIVLPNEMRSGAAPAASTISISAAEAVSKHEPSETSRESSSGARVRLTGVEDPAVVSAWAKVDSSSRTTSRSTTRHGLSSRRFTGNHGCARSSVCSSQMLRGLRPG